MRLFTLLQKIVTKINKNSNDIAAMGDYVIEQYQDGAFGYTKWKSGKLEQWGRNGVQSGSGSSTIQATFPSAFIDTNYSFIATGKNNINAPIAENIYTSLSPGRTTTTTVVSVYKSELPYWIEISWYAVGFWKSGGALLKSLFAFEKRWSLA